VEVAEVRAPVRGGVLCGEVRLIPFCPMGLIHPARVLAHPLFQFPGQIVTDASRCALLGRHLTSDLAEVGAVGAGEACQSDCRAGLTDKVFQVLQSDCFVSTRHEMSITQYLA